MSLSCVPYWLPFSPSFGDFRFFSLALILNPLLLFSQKVSMINFDTLSDSFTFPEACCHLTYMFKFSVSSCLWYLHQGRSAADTNHSQLN